MRPVLVPAVLVLAFVLPGCTLGTGGSSPGAFQPQPRNPWPIPAPPAKLPEVTPELVKEAIKSGVERLVAMQEGDPRSEWPYEGVYRVAGLIPMGYRIGGTAIVVQALANAPGYDEDVPRRQAIDRAVAFICENRNHATMSIDDYAGGYDVRGWGYIEAISCLCRLKSLGRMPGERAGEAELALAWYLDALQRIEIPQAGGWNYARAARDQKAAPSPFMTVRALQALFDAQAAGLGVNAEVVSRGLDVLEKARAASGAVIYSGAADGRTPRRSDGTPGAIGRMTSAETTLLLGGRGRERDVRASVDAFLANWQWLDQRRAKPGTHEGPYAIAPYYFMFAHLYAAQAAERLSASERAEYRRRVREILFLSRNEDGTWNDRVFLRSSAYGTAMALLALMQEDIKPTEWSPPVEKQPAAGAPGT
ncbi:hypothetical protein PHYC_02548 [Phycisphaerales bacterium]|nr:hypothetical protein PHYC_02548 [Phycisphaerales bacterium]